MWRAGRRLNVLRSGSHAQPPPSAVAPRGRGARAGLGPFAAAAMAPKKKGKGKGKKDKGGGKGASHAARVHTQRMQHTLPPARAAPVATTCT